MKISVQRATKIHFQLFQKIMTSSIEFYLSHVFFYKAWIVSILSIVILQRTESTRFRPLYDVKSINKRFFRLSWGRIDENCLICTKSFTVVNNKVKNYNDITFGSKNHFFIAGSPKFADKIRLQSGKYSLLLARICNPCQYIIQPQCSNPDNWKWHRLQTSVSKSTDEYSLSKQKCKINDRHPTKQESIISRLTRNKELKNSVVYFTVEKIEFLINHKKKQN